MQSAVLLLLLATLTLSSPIPLHKRYDTYDSGSGSETVSAADFLPPPPFIEITAPFSRIATVTAPRSFGFINDGKIVTAASVGETSAPAADAGAGGYAAEPTSAPAYEVSSTPAAVISTTAVVAPTTSAEAPTTSAEAPTTTAEAPTTTAEAPTTIAEAPTTIAEAPYTTTAATAPTTMAATYAAPASTDNKSGALAFNKFYATLTTASSCNPNDLATFNVCIDGVYAQCSEAGKYIMHTQCAKPLGCFALPLEDGTGISVACTSADDAAFRMGVGSGKELESMLGGGSGSAPAPTATHSVMPSSSAAAPTSTVPVPTTTQAPVTSSTSPAPVPTSTTAPPNNQAPVVTAIPIGERYITSAGVVVTSTIYG